MGAAGIRFRRGTVHDLDALRPLWVGVHHQHQASMPELAPYVTDEATWTERRKLYVQVLAKPDTILLLAYDDAAADGPALVGYGLAHVVQTGDTWIADTWRRGERIGEIESLAVSPSHRGHGIGTALLEQLESTLAAIGVEDLILGVVAGNVAAQRLYARRGYLPTWLYMSRSPSKRSGVRSPGLGDL
ncbi:MAG: GNAT family N-acetyltransferase [Actinomycetales bacterium]